MSYKNSSTINISVSIVLLVALVGKICLHIIIYIFVVRQLYHTHTSLHLGKQEAVSLRFCPCVHAGRCTAKTQLE